VASWTCLSAAILSSLQSNLRLMTTREIICKTGMDVKSLPPGELQWSPIPKTGTQFIGSYMILPITGWTKLRSLIIKKEKAP